jgi:hypothetical protein
MTMTSHSEIKTLNFEAVKVALKQDKTGYVLTLCVHPDDIPNELLRDFVGSHYQVVMVRLNDENQPLNRDGEFEGDRAIRLAGVLCREKEFWEYLNYEGQIFEANEESATEWLRDYLGVNSRSELKTNQEARLRLKKVNEEYKVWRTKS